MYSPLYEKALRFAMKHHGSDTRKGSEIPYVTHVIHVGHILARHGFDEEVVAAALLHDVIEDTPVELEEVEDLFGERVAAIVADLTENKRLKPPERKARILEVLRESGRDSRAVKAADVLHNMSTTLDDLDRLGSEVWERFRDGREKLDYYADVLEVLAEDGWTHEILEEGRQVLEELRNL